MTTEPKPTNYWLHWPHWPHAITHFILVLMMVCFVMMAFQLRSIMVDVESCRAILEDPGRMAVLADKMRKVDQGDQESISVVPEKTPSDLPFLDVHACPKCGWTKAWINWNEKTKTLDTKCGRCLFKWTAPPRDRSNR